MQGAQRLPRYLALAYAILTAYACLHPFTGWHDIGVSPLAFLVAPWPRYVTLPDLWLNVLGFVPLGFTVAASFRPGLRHRSVVLLTVLICAGLSCSLEILQNYLPTRVASNVDLGTNTLGALIGAVAGVRWRGIFDDNGMIDRWRRHHMLPGHIGEIGLIMVALWWLTQLEPTSTLFGTGDMRPLFNLPAAMSFSARRFVLIETLIVSISVLAVGLLVSRCMRRPGALTVCLVLFGGIAVRSIADHVFMDPPQPLLWATPGAVRGLVIGLTALIVAWQLPGWLQHSIACLSLLFATTLVNIAPENPFQLASMRLLQENHFLNFHGLTRLADCVWPFLALVYLSANAALSRR